MKDQGDGKIRLKLEGGGNSVNVHAVGIGRSNITPAGKMATCEIVVSELGVSGTLDGKLQSSIDAAEEAIKDHYNLDAPAPEPESKPIRFREFL